MGALAGPSAVMISAVVVGPRVGFVFQTLAPGPALIHVAPGFGGVLGNESGVRQPALVVRPTLPSRPLDQRDSSGPEASPRGLALRRTEILGTEPAFVIPRPGP